MYIFLDPSNIRYINLDSGKSSSSKIEYTPYRSNFRKMLHNATRDRLLDAIFFPKIVPHVKESLWKAFPAEKVKTFGKGTEIDDIRGLQKDLRLELFSLLGKEEPDTVALITVDGAERNVADDYFENIEVLEKHGWKFEGYSWDSKDPDQLRNFAKGTKENWKYIETENCLLQ